MQNYQYQARDNAGRLIVGKREGTSADSIAAQLKSEGVIPIVIDSIQASTALKKKLFTNITFGGVKPSEMIMFARQMYSLYRSGIPLDAAVLSLSETMNNPLLLEALKGIGQRLSEGQTLANAMQDYPKIFSEFIIRLIQVGEVSGKLDETFLQIAEYLELQNDTSRRIKTVLRYPIFVITTIVAAVVIVNIFIIPQFIPIFTKSGLILPLPTKILIRSSDFMRNNFLTLAGIIVLIAMAVRYFIKTPYGKVALGKYQLRLPIFGNILLRITLARFTRTFTLTLRAGLAITNSLQLVANSNSNAYAKEKFLSIKNAIERGETLTAAAANTKLFTPLVLQMLAVGERTGSMDKVLGEVTAFYEKEVEYDIQTLSARVEPIILVVVAVMVLMLALGVFLPIWDLTKLTQ